MKAAICARYGPPEVLLVTEIEKPRPSDDEILVRIHASTVNSGDWFIRSGIPHEPVFMRMMTKLMLGVRRLRRQILDLIVAGEVVAVGAAVTRFRVGDREVTAVCGQDNAELVRNLGADQVLDYTKASTPPEGALYDLVLDTVGKRKTSALRTACEHALRPGGRALSVDDGTPELSRAT